VSFQWWTLVTVSVISLAMWLSFVRG